jgi:hypothetical protein
MIKLLLRDSYEMIATSLLYFQSKFELSSMNAYGSVKARVDVCFVTASQKWSKINSSNFMQSSFASSWGRALSMPMKNSESVCYRFSVT